MLDYHVHTSLSDDSNIPYHVMLSHACRLGLKEIAITDHDDPEYPDEIYPFSLDYDSYHQMLEQAEKEFYKKITVKKGLELGIMENALEKCQERANAYPYDFIIGSFHTGCGLLLDTGDFYEGRTGLEIHEAFYKDVFQCLSKMKEYSVVGHLNIVDRYLHSLRPKEEINPKGAMEYIEEILKMVIYDGKGIELNTSSFRYDLPILTPSLEILQMYYDLGGEILTLGSDAHSPDYIADHFEYACEVLSSIGFRYVSVFRERKPDFVKINSL